MDPVGQPEMLLEIMGWVICYICFALVASSTSSYEKQAYQASTTTIS